MSMSNDKSLEDEENAKKLNRLMLENRFLIIFRVVIVPTMSITY